MKSYEFLEMMLDCGISYKAVGMVTIRKQGDVEVLFDTTHDREVEPGRYAYVRSDEISDEVFGNICNVSYDTIFTEEPDEKHPEEGVPVMFLIYLLEDYPIERRECDYNP